VSDTALSGGPNRSTGVMRLHPPTDRLGMTISCTAPTVGALASARVHPSWWSRLIDWIVEARSHRVICVVLGIWLLNAFDLTFTILSHEQGLLHEQNPLARHMLQNGTPSIMLYKIGLVLIGTYPLLKFRKARITEMAALLVFLSYATLAVRWSTCYELYCAAFPDNTNIAVVTDDGEASASQP